MEQFREIVYIIYHFKLEDGFDFLILRGNRDDDAPENLTGLIRPHQRIFEKGTISLQFITDESFSATGFKISYAVSPKSGKKR